MQSSLKLHEEAQLLHQANQYIERQQQVYLLSNQYKQMGHSAKSLQEYRKPERLTELVLLSTLEIQLKN